MVSKRCCDRCGSTTNVRLAVLTAKGIHVPEPEPRQSGFRRSGAIDLCESCRVSMQAKWSEGVS